MRADRLTDGLTDMVIPVYPPNFVAGGGGIMMYVYMVSVDGSNLPYSEYLRDKCMVCSSGQQTQDRSMKSWTEYNYGCRGLSFFLQIIIKDNMRRV